MRHLVVLNIAVKLYNLTSPVVGYPVLHDCNMPESIAGVHTSLLNNFPKFYRDQKYAFAFIRIYDIAIPCLLVVRTKCHHLNDTNLVFLNSLLIRRRFKL